MQRLFLIAIKRYLLRYPLPERLLQFQRLSRLSWIRSSLDRIKPEVLPEDGEDSCSEAAIESTQFIAPPGIASSTHHYHQYRCPIADPLNCQRCLDTNQQQSSAPDCATCGFPAALTEASILNGRQGVYRLGQCLGRRGAGRLYRGTRVDTEEPVAIKEYLLPHRYFNDQECQQRQNMFTSLAGIALADGRSQDMRIVMPIEAIASDRSRRCYLIANSVDASTSFNQWLVDRPPLDEQEVRETLDRILQTLVCLHQQKFLLPSGQVCQGLQHGNLQLESALRVEHNDRTFVILTDFLLWEWIFNPSIIEAPTTSPAQDLAALGRLAFYLLVGQTTDAAGETLSMSIDRHWPEVDPPLKQFIVRLTSESVPFESAEAARMALHQLPQQPTHNTWSPDGEESTESPRSWLSLVAILAVLAFLSGLAGALTWHLLSRPKQSAIADAPSLCCYEEVSAIPRGEFAFASVKSDVLHQILEQPKWEQLEESERPLLEILSGIWPDLSLHHTEVDSVEQALARVRSGEAEFAILPQLARLPEDMSSTVIAYDGLVVFVAFNYQGRDMGLPSALDGQLELSTISQLFTAAVTNWQTISHIPLPLHLYRPDDPTAVTTFEAKILQDPSFITAFQSLPDSRMQTLEPLPMLREIIRDFESRGRGSVGFAPLSAVFGQCSIYPLAIARPNQPAVQPLRMSSGEAIDPSVDLCARKGSYWPHKQAFRDGHYPLAYPLTVVYPFDNSRSTIGRKFAEMLVTLEGQQLLERAGLISIAPLPNHNTARASNSNRSD